MKGSRYSEEQIISMLKEHEAGMKTADLCRKHGVPPALVHKSRQGQPEAHRVAKSDPL
jgi:putative transposase